MRYLLMACVATTLAMLVSFKVVAADIAVCGASKGYGYYPKIGLAASDASAGEWSEDGISNGRLTATRANDNSYDIIILDSSDSMFSARADGAAVELFGKTDKTLTLLVIYPKLIETYTFLRNVDGQAEVMWTQNKHGTLIPKVSAFQAPCSFLEF